MASVNSLCVSLVPTRGLGSVTESHFKGKKNTVQGQQRGPLLLCHTLQVQRVGSGERKDTIQPGLGCYDGKGGGR